MTEEELLFLDLQLIDKFTRDARKRWMQLHGAGLRKSRISQKKKDVEQKDE